MKFLWKIALVSMLSSLLLWVLEVLQAFVRVPRSEAVPASAGDCAVFLLLSLLLFAGWGSVAAVVQGVYLSAMTFLHRRAERRWGRAPARTFISAIVTATIMPYLFHFSGRLFSGRGISQFAYVSHLRGVFLIICVFAVFALAYLVVRNARAWLSPAWRARRNLALLCSGAALLLLYAVNAGLYIGQYGFVHRAAGLVLFLLAEFTVLNLLGVDRLTGILGRRMSRGLIGTVFLLPLVIAIMSFTTSGIPLGSRQLSSIYSRTHLGKKLVWLYGFRDEVGAVDAGFYRDYLARRDAFVRSAPTIRRKGYNLVFIMVDALRADHLPMYGYGRNTAPHLGSFASRSVLFPHHYSQGYNTETSLPADLTGCYFSTVERGGGIGGFETLPEMLLRNGYATWALMQPGAVVRLEEKGRAGAAFEIIETARPEYAAPDIVRRAVELLERRDRGRPFFLFLFFGEPHAPYVPHEGIDYGSGAEDLYDGEISYVDQHINELLKYLWSSGLDKDTVIVVTADHGEELGQYGGWGHGIKLYNAIIHLPLIVYIPGADPGVIGEQVQSIDICPSLVELLDLRTDAQFDGSSFLPYIAGARPGYIPLVFTEAEFGPTRKVGLVYYPWKLVYHISDSYFALYNLEYDPLERVNRIEDDGEVAAMLKNILLSWLSYRDSGRRGGEEASDPEVAALLDRLREHDEGALPRLANLADRALTAGDFALLAGALEPYLSSHAAAFFLATARRNEHLQAQSIDALRSLVRQAQLIAVESDLAGDRSEMMAIFRVSSDADSAQLLLSLVSRGDDTVAEAGLDIIGIAGGASIRDDLFQLYSESDPEARAAMLPVLCRLGEPRVEDELFVMVEGMPDGKLKDVMSLFVSSKSERCRDYLVELVRTKSKKGHFRLMDRISMEIWKSRNRFMLPVLKEIFCLRRGGKQMSYPRLSFSKKAAIMAFVDIKGRGNLDADDRRAIKEAYESDVYLEQYDELRKLYGAL